MNEIIENEQIGWFENMKKELKDFLELYLEERLNSKWENEKKQSFLDKFNSFWLKEKREYRDYLYQVIKNPLELKEQNDDLSQIQNLLENLKSIDKLEIYAWVCNNCKSWTNLQENPIFPEAISFETPNFIINSWSLKVNWQEIKIWTLSSDYMWNWNYQLFLSDYLDKETLEKIGSLKKWIIWELPKSLIIWKDKVFTQDSLWTYEIKNIKISNKKIIVNIPWYWINLILDKTNI